MRKAPPPALESQHRSSSKVPLSQASPGQTLFSAGLSAQASVSLLTTEAISPLTEAISPLLGIEGPGALESSWVFPVDRNLLFSPLNISNNSVLYETLLGPGTMAWACNLSILGD